MQHRSPKGILGVQPKLVRLGKNAVDLAEERQLVLPLRGHLFVLLFVFLFLLLVVVQHLVGGLRVSNDGRGQRVKQCLPVARVLRSNHLRRICILI